MRKKFIWLSACLVAQLVIGSCGGPKGACVRGAGSITAMCGDDFTRGQCDIVSGTSYPGATCSSLGFR